MKAKPVLNRTVHPFGKVDIGIHADFISSNLQGANFTNAVLYGTRFTNSNLSEVDFRGSKFSVYYEGSESGTRVSFDGSDLTGSNLQNVDITCEQLVTAKNWQKAYRTQELACGETIPVIPE